MPSTMLTEPTLFIATAAGAPAATQVVFVQTTLVLVLAAGSGSSAAS
jgi:hypothetical protein